jgi:polysulfide reductase-like protein
VTATERHASPAVSTTAPEAIAGTDGIRSYHGQPVLKEPIWTWEIPCYFFAGGLAGGSAGLAFLAGVRGNDQLAKRSWGAALAAASVSPALLISDLGRPARFLNMLRMFKVTSPMSVGSWLLLGVGGSTAAAALDAWTGLFPRVGRVARPLAATLGLPLTTYTAALVANTAIPVWHEARGTLPFVFAAGAAMSSGGAGVAVTPPAAAAPARRLALGGAVAGLVATEVMERRLGEHSDPYKHGAASRFRLLGRTLGGCGAALLARRGGASRPAAVTSGMLLGGAALATRWSVYKAGFQSAADPKYVIGPQRARIERRQRRGASRKRPR